MTEPTAPPDQLPPSGDLSLPELPPVPDVNLRGPSRLRSELAAAAAVDGVAVIFFDPTTHNPHLVFVSDGLAALLDTGVDELLGQSPQVMFPEGEGRAAIDELRRALHIGPQHAAVTRDIAVKDLELPHIDLSDDRDLIDDRDLNDRYDEAEDEYEDSDQADDEFDDYHQADGYDQPGDYDQPDDYDEAAEQYDSEPSSASRIHTATQTLRTGGLTGDRGSALVHATYTTVPSMTPIAPYVLVQYRDLGKAAAESLLADEAAVIGSLSRGHELGRLCHQIASEIESETDNGSRCWIGVVNADGLMEPVISGDHPFEQVADIMRTVAEAGAAAVKRVVPIDGLPDHQARLLRTEGTRCLWYVPMVGSGGVVRGALLVATADEQPGESITRSLDHLASVMATAVEHATAEADFAHQTLHDPLTHLPNRALIVDRLGQSLARLERDGIALSVLLVDIDRFRTVNDTRGVEVGDEVLLEVAARLLAAVRLGDTVGRVSSDQYLIMCVATSGELDAAAVGRRILRSLSEPIVVSKGPPLHITASVGVAVIDEPGPSPAVIISNAESALARAAASGRGQMAMFEADLRRHVVDRHETEQALHRAITQEELVIHYQPLVEIRTGFIVGAEALVRWDRPGHGLIYPPAFIQIAEESELILPMGNWIIDKVCSDLGRWPKSNGRSPMVTINLAARQLAVDTLVPTVVSALQRNSLHPARVGFEITESMEIRDVDAAAVNLNRLAELGCRIAIDDFGIGHATLAYIRQFSMANALKIDRSFVAGLGNSKEDTAIVNASIALAESLGLQVIAEGVENFEQLESLYKMGCRFAQGFGLARPMPFDDVLKLWNKARLYEPLASVSGRALDIR